ADRRQGVSRQAALGDRLSGQRPRTERGQTLVTHILRCCFAIAVAFAALGAQPVFVQPASATTIERVISPGGIEAWLVKDPSVPLIAMNFAVNGGSTEDPEGKAGTAYMVSSMLDEGAGPLDARAYHQQPEDKAAGRSRAAPY